MERINWGGFVRRGAASVIIDGQFGSTGKGLIAAYLAEKTEDGQFDMVTTNAAPNAGHTAKWRDGRVVLTKHLPTYGVVNGYPSVMLNAGAIINMDVLKAELAKHPGVADRLVIHPRAAIISPEDVNQESLSSSGATAFASTRQGVGNALARKVMRVASLAKDEPSLIGFVRRFGSKNFTGDMTWDEGAWSVLIEVPQGFDLGLNSGLSYPHCTSREVTVSQALSDAGLHPSQLNKTLMTLRTFPIRVGHIYDGDGFVIGNSGPHHTDQKELSWDFLGVEPEMTTVTRRVRRVFSWSQKQFKRSYIVNRPDVIFLNFVNYLSCKDHLRFLLDQMGYVMARVSNSRPIPIIFGLGPCVEDVTESVQKAMDSLPSNPIYKWKDLI